MSIIDVGIFLEEEGITYSKLKLNQWLFEKIKPSSYIKFDQFLELISSDVIKSSGITGNGMFGGGSGFDTFHNLSMLQASKSATLKSIKKMNDMAIDDKDKVECLEGHLC
jgi:hypothetical protein